MMSKVEERFGGPECASVGWAVKKRDAQIMTAVKRTLNIMPLLLRKLVRHSYLAHPSFGKQKIYSTEGLAMSDATEPLTAQPPMQ